MTTRSTFSALAGALLALGTLAACGGSGGGGGSGDEVASLGTDASTEGTATDGTAVDAPTDPEEAMLAYTQCMRDHGIDMPDPQKTGPGGGGVIAIEADAADGQFQEAQEACEPIMAAAVDSIERDPEREAEMKEDLLAFAACMREHGVDMPDPTFDENGRVTMSADGPPPEREVEDFQAAAEECSPDGMFMSTPAVRVGGED